MSQAPQARLLRACRCLPVDHTPVWLMRQAGRYLPEYRALRERHDFLEMVTTPELACEVTLQPLRRFDLDAAIIFADILPPLERLGLGIEFERGHGPAVRNPVRGPADVARLPDVDDDEAWAFTLEAIRLVRAELDPAVPLIGFSGAPFTLACYAIEGGGSRDFSRARQFMTREHAAWTKLMTSLAQLVGRYLRAQIAAGVQVVQLFDTWAGLLDQREYHRHVFPYSAAALQEAGTAAAEGAGGDGPVPIIHFATGGDGLLEPLRDAGADVVGVDHHTDLAEARRRLGPDVAVQGNLDPEALLGDHAALDRAAAAVLAAAAGRPGHIFNLGHGVLPQTPPDNVRRLVEYVHERSTGHGGAGGGTRAWKGGAGGGTRARKGGAGGGARTRWRGGAG